MMKIDWKARFKNRTFWMSAISATVLFVYQILGLFGIVPPVSSDEIIQFGGLALNILVGIGIIVDPSTSGMSDKTKS